MECDNLITSVSWIRERDIDLLLTSELYSETTFSRWFFERCGFSDAHFISARISVTDAYGETDVFVEGKYKNSRIIILVEHKISASLQFEQDIRYQKREQYVAGNDDETFATSVLIAPQQYLLTSENNFPNQISFEDMIAEIRTYNDSRSNFFGDLLGVGIKYQKHGYRKVIHEDTSHFWMSYYQLAIAEFPELRMRQPDGKPSGSNFCQFRDILQDDILGKKTVLVHKWPHGNADLQFSTTQPEELQSLVKLENEMIIVKTNKSASIRIKVPALDTHAPFNGQINEARIGLAAIKKLYNFGHSLKI